ncbi:hypothetical protein EDD22DRAFT_994789 [Suillus occidentalis]|nr:hypothetical protein EDD22DRAFT_994789 [Suillus occidentalis]
MDLSCLRLMGKEKMAASTMLASSTVTMLEPESQRPQWGSLREFNVGKLNAHVEEEEVRERELDKLNAHFEEEDMRERELNLNINVEEDTLRSMFTSARAVTYGMSIFAKVVEIPLPPSRVRLDSDSSPKCIGRSAAHASNVPGRRVLSFAEVRRGLESHDDDHRLNFYPPPGATSRSQVSV